MRKLNAVVLTILAVATVTVTSPTIASAASPTPVAAAHTAAGIGSNGDTGWGNTCPPAGEPAPPYCPTFP